MKNVDEILERQSARLNFEDGKVKYFSISTQHAEADTIEEAIQNIIEADAYYEGKSSMRYAIEQYEKELPIPEYEDIDVSKEDMENILNLLIESSKRYLGIKK